MIVLEIAMLLVGVLAVVYSVRLSEKNKGTETLKERVEFMEYSDFPEKEWMEKIDKLREKAEDVYNEIDDKLSKLSNEKIMGMNEYSDQVLDKIEKNHGEVVFLYDRMNEKQAEIQKTVEEVDTIRASLKDDTEKEFQKLIEKEETLDQMKQDIEMEALEIQSKQKEIKESQKEIKESQKEIEESQKKIEESQRDMEEKQRHMGDFATDDLLSEISESLKSETTASEVEGEVSGKDDLEKENSVTEEEPSVEGEKKTGLELAKQSAAAKKEREKENMSASDVIDAEIKRIEEEEEQEQKEKREEEMFSDSGYRPLSEQEEPKNHNDEIIDLYKKGRSVIEISKMLSLGQGEVKFVIDLYNAR
ncbi:MAG: hypothetical protein IJ733_01465 [Lachnospiraceae bacterium]|nr:hypothetical protein [Lachnospiraceae bacterium]